MHSRATVRNGRRLQIKYRCQNCTVALYNTILMLYFCFYYDKRTRVNRHKLIVANSGERDESGETDSKTVGRTVTTQRKTIYAVTLLRLPRHSDTGGGRPTAVTGIPRIYEITILFCVPE